MTNTAALRSQRGAADNAPVIIRSGTANRTPENRGYRPTTPHNPALRIIDIAGHYDNTLDRCLYICNDRAMDVYQLDDIGRETEEMASVKTRQSYKDLPAAFAYRDKADFQGCDLPRYYRRADEMLARTVTPKNLQAAAIPLPQAKPELLDGTVTAYIAETPETRPATPRKVGVVGAPFLRN